MNIYLIPKFQHEQKISNSQDHLHRNERRGVFLIYLELVICANFLHG